MKFSFATVLLSLPLAANGLAAPSRGFVHKFFADRTKAHWEDDSWLDRFKNRFVGDAKKNNDVLNGGGEEVWWDIKEDGIFGFVPTKEMTGVDPHMTQLCCTLSAQLYTKKSLEEFKLSTKDHKTEVLLYDDHGDFLASTVPFGIAVCGDTMVLGWRGTGTVSDAINDAAATPQSSFAWRKHAKTIKAQGAMTSIVINDVVTHEEFIIKEIQKRGIKEIITTGQSLGGGCSQLGHMVLRAQIQDETSPWNVLDGKVNVRSVAFCGPMTTVLLDNASDETDEFLQQIDDNSVNFIFNNDPVPRGYGYLTFIEDLIENAAPSLLKESVPWFIRRTLNLRDKMEDLYEKKDNKAVQDMVKVFSKYQHMGKLIYYAEEDAKPQVVRDMGAFYANPAGDQDILRDIKYQPIKTFSFDEALRWHMHIITGPGLAYPEEHLH